MVNFQPKYDCQYILFLVCAQMTEYFPTKGRGLGSRCLSPLLFQQYFSYIVAVSFIGGGNRNTRRIPQSCRNSLTNFITCCIGLVRFEITLLVVIGTDCTGSCKSKYHVITTPSNKELISSK